MVCISIKSKFAFRHKCQNEEEKDMTSHPSAAALGTPETWPVDLPRSGRQSDEPGLSGSSGQLWL